MQVWIITQISDEGEWCGTSVYQTYASAKQALLDWIAVDPSFADEEELRDFESAQIALANSTEESVEIEASGYHYTISAEQVR